MTPADILPIAAWAPVTAHEAMAAGLVVVALLIGALIRGVR